MIEFRWVTQKTVSGVVGITLHECSALWHSRVVTFPTVFIQDSAVLSRIFKLTFFEVM